MAVDITQYTNQISNALYGRDVRSSIVNALRACAAQAGITIQGTYASLADLQAAHPTGNTGDYYIAGYVLYYWNGSAWEDAGQILPNVKVTQNADGSVTITSVDQTGTTAATLSEAQIFLAAHPVGSLFWSSDSTSPASLYGGTWRQIKDKFILAAGDTYTAGATGGSATHSHYEAMGVKGSNLYMSAAQFDTSHNPALTLVNGLTFSPTTVAVDATYITSTTSNMPPYEVKYCWERTA